MKSRRRIAFTKARTTPTRTRLQQGFATGEMGFGGRFARQQLMSALGQKRTLEHLRAMSALPPKADIETRSRDVRFVPIGDIMPCPGSRASRPQHARWRSGQRRQNKEH